jgi:hypothetical protein
MSEGVTQEVTRKGAESSGGRGGTMAGLGVQAHLAARVEWQLTETRFKSGTLSLSIS